MGELRGEEAARGACLEDELVLADLDGVLLADLVVLGDVCERKEQRKSERWIGFGGGGEGGGLVLERARAFLDLAEGVGLHLEIFLHLADGHRGRRRRHGLAAAAAASSAAAAAARRRPRVGRVGVRRSRFGLVTIDFLSGPGYE